MAIYLEELTNLINFEFDDAGLTAAQKKLSKLGDSFMKAGKRLTFGLTLPILGLTAASVKAASDAEETVSKFGVVFQDVSDEAENAAQNLVDNYGLARTESKKLLGDTGDLLSGFGFTGEAALDLSVRTQQLAVDLASFTNVEGGAKRASEALTKALLGERESVKQLGIAIIEKDVKDRVALLRARGMRFETERQAKAYATLELAQEQSKNAIGDFARTNQSFANQLKLVGKRISNILTTYGTMVIETLRLDKVLIFLNKTLGKLDKFLLGLNSTQKKILVILPLIAAAIGPILIGVGVLIKLSAILGVSIGAILVKVLLIPALVVAAVTLIILIIEDLIGFFHGRDSVTGIIVKEIKKTIDDAVFYYKFLFTEFKNWIISIASKVKDTFVNMFTSIKDNATALLQKIPLLGRFLGGDLNATVTSSGASALGARSNQSNVNVQSRVNVQVPQGTTAEQQQVLRDTAQTAVNDAFNQRILETLQHNPEIE